jgi:hypothetical protein
VADEASFRLLEESTRTSHPNDRPELSDGYLGLGGKFFVGNVARQRYMFQYIEADEPADASQHLVLWALTLETV